MRFIRRREHTEEELGAEVARDVATVVAPERALPPTYEPPAGIRAPARARRATNAREPHDGWTFVLIPPGTNARPRTVNISVRRLRFMLASGVAMVGGTFGVGALVILALSVTPDAQEEVAGVRLGILAADTPVAFGLSSVAMDTVAASALASPLGASVVLRAADAGSVAPSAVPREPAASRTKTSKPAPAPVRIVRPRRDVIPASAGDVASDAGVISALPVIGRITSRWAQARRHPILGVVRRHKGLDIAAPAGTRITAPAAGRVIFAGRKVGFGRVVEISHGHGVVTRYAHCRSLFVTVGEQIEAGQVIGAVGATGLATGPHLHYEILINGESVDPLKTSLAHVLHLDGATPRTVAGSPALQATSPTPDDEPDTPNGSHEPSTSNEPTDSTHQTASEKLP